MGKRRVEKLSIKTKKQIQIWAENSVTSDGRSLDFNQMVAVLGQGAESAARIKNNEKWKNWIHDGSIITAIFPANWHWRKKSLDLTLVDNLKILHCANSNLSELRLETRLDHLIYFNCKYNQLSNLDLAFFPSLKTLLCDNNPLVELDFSMTPNLDVLRCGQKLTGEQFLISDLFCCSKETVIPHSLLRFGCNTSELEDLQKIVTKVLSALPVKDEKLVRMRYGIGLSAPSTFEEVGTVFDMDIDTVRDHISCILRKLKHPVYSRHLRPFENLCQEIDIQIFTKSQKEPL